MPVTTAGSVHAARQLRSPSPRRASSRPRPRRCNTTTATLQPRRRIRVVANTSIGRAESAKTPGTRVKAGKHS